MMRMAMMLCVVFVLRALLLLTRLTRAILKGAAALPGTCMSGRSSESQTQCNDHFFHLLLPIWWEDEQQNATTVPNRK